MKCLDRWTFKNTRNHLQGDSPDSTGAHRHQQRGDLWTILKGCQALCALAIADIAVDPMVLGLIFGEKFCKDI